MLSCAAAVLSQRGWTRGVTFDPKNGRVDVLGAIAIAAGVKPQSLLSDDVLDAIPQALLPGAMFAIEAIESQLNCDLAEWNDQSGQRVDLICRTLNQLASLLGASNGFG